MLQHVRLDRLTSLRLERTKLALMHIHFRRIRMHQFMTLKLFHVHRFIRAQFTPVNGNLGPVFVPEHMFLVIGLVKGTEVAFLATIHRHLRRIHVSSLYMDVQLGLTGGFKIAVGTVQVL